MNFEFSEEQVMLRGLAREILEAEATPDRAKAAESRGDGFDDRLWASLADANLLGLAIPSEHGGMGFGLLELCVLLEEVGRMVAPVPVLPALVYGALPIARFGSEEQRAKWLGPVAAGDRIVSGVLPGAAREGGGRPGTAARRAGDDWLLSGSEPWVAAVDFAERIVVPASIEGGAGLFLLDPRAEGVSRTPQIVTNRERRHDLSLADVRVAAEDVLPVSPLEGAAALSWMRDAALIGTCAMQLGVSERALELTAAYVREREQFGQPIGSFQAVQHRCADRYIDLMSMRWTLWRAAWRFSEGEDTERDAMVAKFWAAEGGARIASTAQHLHAGAGVDLDYAIHRYFLWTKALELNLGAATPQLVRLGRDMARTGPKEYS